MPRYKIIVEYDGGPFVGWQTQDNGLGVQTALVQAIEGLSGETVQVTGAGRTDAGVHALGQVADFALARAFPLDNLRDGMNYHLRPHPIAVVAAEEVADTFSARFDAFRRHYLYRLINRRPPLTVSRGRAWRVPQALSAKAMHEAAQHLVGKHDFTTFRAVQCQAKSPVKTLEEITVERVGETLSIRVSAPSFLHNQVRSIAGSLKLVGEGKWSAADFKAALEARDRKACGPVAPAEGLYLARVDYPPAGAKP